MNNSINAYKNEVYSETRSTVSVSNADSVVRHNMTDKMVSLATVKWKMAPTNGKTLYFYDSLNKGNPNEYAPSDTIRYGLPYVNTIESTLYAFTKNGSNKSTLDGSVIYNYQLPSKYKKRAKTTLGTYVEEDETISGNLYVHESGSADSATSSTRYQKIQEIAFVPNDDYFYGVDCSSSMYYAQGTELPIITNMAGAQRFTSDIEVKALNGVDINFSDFEDSLRDNNTIDSEHGIEYAITNYFGKYVKSKNSTQKILESYALAVPGDVIAKTGSESHTRMISGYPYIECNDGTSKRMSSSTSYTVGFCDNHGGINATNSYIITTELSGRGFNPYKEANASSGPYKDNQVPISQTNWSFTIDPE